MTGVALDTEHESTSAFAFDGTWREFAPIAFTNLLLTIVTLGIYRFWAVARERRYFWSRSRFVDERLEWAGTGLELFIGFVLVGLLIFLPFFGINLLTQALVLRGHTVLAGLLTVGVIVMIFYLYGVARFRALRYRLSRTRWRGIRGGSDHQGFRFGLSYMWKTALGYLPAGLLIPWSMTSLWNERVSQMSFGPHAFRADAEAGPLFVRYLLFYAAPFILFVGIIAAGGAAVATGAISQTDPTDPSLGIAFFLIIVAIILFFYLGLGLIAVAIYAKYYRVVVGATAWEDLTFAFEASTRDWIKLLLGDVAIVVLTLGIGWIFLGYRHWKFFIVHMEAYGEIDLDRLTQSTTATSRHGEGLLDAFDIGAV